MFSSSYFPLKKVTKLHCTYLELVVDLLAPVESGARYRHVQNLSPILVVDQRQAHAVDVQDELVAPDLFEAGHLVIQAIEPVHEHEHFLQAVQKGQAVGVPGQCHLELLLRLKHLQVVHLVMSYKLFSWVNSCVY